MSLMNVGVSALNANQQALTTVGHNIANVNTPGYSRQTVYTNALHGQNMGNGFIGKGVQVATVMRNYSALLNRQSNAANAIHAADTSRLQGLMQMQDVFKGGDGSLGAAVTNMMNAFVDVQAAPSDATGRNVVLTRMSELAARFHAASNMLEEQDYSTAQQLRNNALLVNDKASQVARLNNEISRALATGHQPNDLLDARDQVIREINQYVQTTQVAADDGSISLFVGGSQALVLGINSGQLSVEETKEYPGSQRMALYFSQPGGQQLELTAAMVGGGEIAGLLKFRNEDLAEGRNLLGRLAMTIGHELNLQNQRGLTLNGQQGGALFSLPTTSTGYGNITGYSNIGPGAATTQVMDASQLKPSEYRLIFEGSPLTPVLTRMSDGKVFNATSTPPLNMGNLATGFDADGLRFIVPAATLAAAVSGNSMLFKPFSTAASEIEALVHNPDELAAASALTANINKNNTGKLQLTQLGANDFTGIPAAQDPVRLTFDGAGQVTYQIYDHLSSTWSAASAPMDYTPGQPITINGWSITLTGTPAAGDTVDVANALDFGEAFRLNAGNAGAFLDMRDKKVFDEGTTLSDGFSAAMAVVGTRTQSVQLAEKLSSTVAKNLEMDRTAVSGVNLDEEAARLLQYQQAYQASSKVIQIAQSLFDSMLNAVAR
mgnify:FL=1